VYFISGVASMSQTAPWAAKGHFCKSCKSDEILEGRGDEAGSHSAYCQIPLHVPDRTGPDQTKSANVVGDPRGPSGLRRRPGSTTKSGRARLMEFGCYRALAPVFRCVDGCRCKYNWLTHKLFVLTQQSPSVFFILQIVVCRPTYSTAKCLRCACAIRGRSLGLQHYSAICIMLISGG